MGSASPDVMRMRQGEGAGAALESHTVVVSRAPGGCYGTEVSDANRVLSIDDGSPAWSGGLLVGDVITKVDGKTLQGPIAAVLAGSAFSKKTSLVLTVCRSPTERAGAVR